MFRFTEIGMEGLLRLRPKNLQPSGNQLLVHCLAKKGGGGGPLVPCTGQHLML